MDYSQALQKLSKHASAPEDSFSLALHRADRQSAIPELSSLFAEILSCFEVVNHALNTSHPSGTIEGKAEALPRSLVADVSSILSVGWSYYWQWISSERFTVAFRTDVASMLVQISIAWDAVLAGDIDDIREHVQTEFSAKGYVA